MTNENSDEAADKKAENLPAEKNKADKPPAISKLFNPIIAAVIIVLSLALLTTSFIVKGGINAISVDANALNLDNTSKLVHVTGELTSEEFKDPFFGVTFNGVSLQRVVEMYQWVEVADEYELQWQNQLVTIETDKTKTNPTTMPFLSEEWKVSILKLGGYTLSQSIAEKATNSKDLQLTKEDLAKLPSDGAKAFKLVDGKFFYGASPENPQLGDFRISFITKDAQTVSVLAKQTSSGLEAFKTGNGIIEKVLPGTHSLESMMSNTNASDSGILPIILMVLSIILLIFGIYILIKSILNKKKASNAEQDNEEESEEESVDFMEDSTPINPEEDIPDTQPAPLAEPTTKQPEAVELSQHEIDEAIDAVQHLDDAAIDDPVPPESQFTESEPDESELVEPQLAEETEQLVEGIEFAGEEYTEGEDDDYSFLEEEQSVLEELSAIETDEAEDDENVLFDPDAVDEEFSNSNKLGEQFEDIDIDSEVPDNSKVLAEIALLNEEKEQQSTPTEEVENIIQQIEENKFDEEMPEEATEAKVEESEVTNTEENIEDSNTDGNEEESSSEPTDSVNESTTPDENNTSETQEETTNDAPKKTSSLELDLEANKDFVPARRNSEAHEDAPKDAKQQVAPVEEIFDEKNLPEGVEVLNESTAVTKEDPPTNPSEQPAEPNKSDDFESFEFEENSEEDPPST